MVALMVMSRIRSSRRWTVIWPSTVQGEFVGLVELAGVAIGGTEA
jgi:hypothetical protein